MSGEASGEYEQIFDNEIFSPLPKPVNALCSKVLEWWDRYKYAEVAAFSSMLAAAYGIPEAIDGINYFMQAPEEFIHPIRTVSMAFGATHAENIGYYSVMGYKHVQEARGDSTEPIVFRDVVKAARGMIEEFGAGEYIDSFIVRPVALGAGKETGGLGGLVTGWAIATGIFYTPTLISYELRKWRDRRNAQRADDE